MGSKIALKNAQDQEFSINHLDNAGAIAINSNDISTKSQIETTIAPYNKGFKNYIINGNFDIWQRGNSQTATSYGSDDRWNNSHNGSTKMHSQVACTNTERALFNASFFSRTVVTSIAGVNNHVQKFQLIENVTKLAGKTVTISFWAKADSSKNIAIEFGQIFGTGGSPSATVSGVGAQLIPLTTTWQKITRTFTFPSIVGKTLGTDGVHTSSTYLVFWFDAGSNFNSRTASLGQQNGTFDIAQVQLEEGSVATPFEQRPIGLELSLCQRYYEVMNEHATEISATTGEAFNTSTTFSVRKRIIPTMNRTQINQSGNPTVNLAAINNWGFYKELICTTTGVSYSIDNISASAEL